MLKPNTRNNKGAEILTQTASQNISSNEHATRRCPFYEGVVKTTDLAGRDLMRLLDLSPCEFQLILDTALEQKAQMKDGYVVAPFAGKSVAIIMEKPSLRTRSSFEIGVAQLGAHPLVLADDHSAFSRGESVKDTTMVLERYVDCIVLRTFEQSKVAEVAKWASIPVINALSDDFHPCQGLADALTILEHKGALKGVKVAYLGDGSNNMANTYCELAAIAGMNLTIGAPSGHHPNPTYLEECLALCEKTGGSITVVEDAIGAVDGADVVITDSWTSMGADNADEASGLFEAFQVNEELMGHAAKDAMFMHCLPAHRGHEVTDEVMDGPWSAIYDEAENRLHVQKALISLVMAQ